MEKGPQHITSMQERVHNTLVQYEKWSTIYKFNMEKGPQYISSIWKRSPIHKFNNMEKGPQYISSIWKRVHNTLLQYRKGSTIHYFSTENGPQ